MKNFERIHATDGKYDTLRLIDENGEFVEFMDLFVASMITRGDAPATVTRYSNAVAQFLDYLCEAGVFGQPCSRTEILEAVDRYLPARLAGPAQAGKYIEIVRDLGHQRLTHTSASNASAALNRFLQLLVYGADLDREIAEWHRVGEVEGEAPKDLFRRLSGAKRSSAEVRKIMRRSMLANVIRWKPNGIKKPPATRVHAQKWKRQSHNKKDLPAEWVMPVLDAASSFRDRAVWALMAGAGLRQSEVAQLTWDAIDVQKQEIFVFDPESLRFADQLPERYVRRFKGRKYSETYILPQLREVFFEALANYVRREHRPVQPDLMVFQDITKSGNGRPYSLLSDKSRIAAFKRACERAGAPRKRGEKIFTPHSLRHFYGVFMLNYVPVDGGYGLTISEVQRLMGHEDQTSTMGYAREDALILETKLQLIDQLSLGQQANESEFTAWLAKRHSDIADRLLANSNKGDQR